MVYNSDENRKKYDALPVLEHRKVSSSVHSTQARKQPKLFPHRLFIIRNNFPFCKGCFSRIKRPGLAYFSSVPDDGSALEVRCFLFLLAVLLAASPMKSSPRCAVLFSPALSRFSGKGFFIAKCSFVVTKTNRRGCFLGGLWILSVIYRRWR